MGTAVFETPDGPVKFEIAGEQPTEQEIELIQSSIFGQDAQAETPEDDFDIATASYEDLRAHFGAGGKDQAYQPTNEGEVEGVSFQYNYAKADNDTGRAMRLAREFGEGTFEKAPDGEFVLLLDKISPEKKEEYNLPGSGTIYVNRPGGDILGMFDLSDVVGFAGDYQGPIIGSMAAGVAAASLGAGIPLSALLVGVGAGVGKAADEFIEEDLVRDLQDQNARDVWKDVAFESVLAATGDFVIGGAGRLIRRVVKGGGAPNKERIFELRQSGLTAKEARDLAGQEARTEVRTAMGTRPDEARIKELVSQGATLRQARRQALKEARETRAVPAIGEATGKSILSRLQGIYEAILPYEGPAIQNAAHVEKLLGQYKRGELSQSALDQALERNSTEVMRIVKNAMRDPDEAVKLANKQLKFLIDGEMDALQKNFARSSNPSEAAYFKEQIGQRVRLWQQNSTELFENANKLLDPDVLAFSTKLLKDEAARIVARPLGSGLKDKPLFEFLDQVGPTISLTDLNVVRQVLQAHGKGSDAVGEVVDADIKNLVNSITKMMEDKAGELAGSYERVMAGGTANEISSGIGTGTRYAPRSVSKATIEQRAKGIEALRAANKHYSDGKEAFNKGKITSLRTLMEEGIYADMVDVADSVIKNRRPEFLRSWLDDLNISNIDELKRLPTDPRVWSDAAQAARNGDVDSVVSFLNNNRITSKVVGRPPEGIAAVLRAGDQSSPFYKLSMTYMDDMAETLSTWADDMVARKSPELMKETNRDILAGVWMREALDSSKKGGATDAASFANKFDALGDEVQNILFKGQAEGFRSLIKDFHLLGSNQQAKLFDETLDNITNKGMRDAVSTLRSSMEAATSQSTDALFKAMRSGRIENADDLILAAMKEPSMVSSLRRVVGEDAFDSVGGLRDKTVEKLLFEAVGDTGLSPTTIASGDFGKNLRAAIVRKDREGLNEILGKDTVEGMLKVADESVRYSNAAMKGKSGLAPAAFAAAFGLRLMTEPVSALTEAASVLAAGRVLRNRHFLNWMTKPTIRAADAERSLRILTEEILGKAQNAGQSMTRGQAEALAKKRLSIGTGPSADLNLKAMKIRELIDREARAVAAMTIGGGMRESVQATGDLARNIATTAVTEPETEDQANMAASLQQAAPSLVNQVTTAGSDFLRQVEEQKMMGAYPGQ